MTQTPQHPSEMDLNVNDVIRYEGGGDTGLKFTVGRNYPVMDDGCLVDDNGCQCRPIDIFPERRFTLVSRADDGWTVRSSLHPDYEYAVRGGDLYRRPRRPKVERIAVTGYVTVTDGVRDWTTFSEKEDL